MEYDSDSVSVSLFPVIQCNCSLSFHCYTQTTDQISNDLTLPIHFSTCKSVISISNSRLYLNDLHVGMLYDREITITNHSPFPTAFSVTIPSSACYVCSVLTDTQNALTYHSSSLMMQSSLGTTHTGSLHFDETPPPHPAVADRLPRDSAACRQRDEYPRFLRLADIDGISAPR